uniref:Flagellar protein FlgJ N-terminal domain-containing protein n=1 Tax=Rhodopseudomonas palustris (strain BisA53) TaxID=316055 RepID=Q07SF0_RHOP5
MTVAPVQDLIVDVMAAADPAAQRVATHKLARAAAGADPDFAATVDRKIDAAALERTEATPGEGSGAVTRAALDGTGHATMIKATGGNSAVYRKFEAFILQMFVESMLPKDATEVFGKGTSGTVWRSMLAEQISNEMAKGNGIGIAKQLEKSRAAADAAAAEG